MIRLMHIITGLERGGAEGMLVRLLQRLDSASFSQTVVSLTTRGVHGDLVEESGARLITLGMRGVSDVPRCLGNLCGLIRELRPAIVQTWLYHADLMGLLAARLASDAIVVWNIRCAGLDPSDIPRSTRWLIRLLTRMSPWPEAVLFNSEAGQRAHMAIGYHPRHSLVIPNGFDLDVWRPDAAKRSSFRSEIGMDDHVFLVGMIARSHQMKDQAGFLAAAARLMQIASNVRFVLAGQGVTWSNASLVTDIDRHRLRDRIFLLGARHDMPRVMAGLDCLVSTSTSEGFPNVLGEAMACGVPCVATDAGDSCLIVGDTGRIVARGDLEGIIEGVMQLLTASGDERALWAAQCRARIGERFELDQIAARYANFYWELDARHN